MNYFNQPGTNKYENHEQFSLDDNVLPDSSMLRNKNQPVIHNGNAIIQKDLIFSSASIDEISTAQENKNSGFQEDSDWSCPEFWFT